MRKIPLFALLVVFMLLAAGCQKQPAASGVPDETKLAPLIRIGFSQLGAESDWRSANTASMKRTFTREKGYELIFEDGQQKQGNQMTALRTFIQQGVDVIVLAPVTEDGWETVLSEVRSVKIPVILMDRMIKTEEEGLFTCHVGSDFYREGRKVCAWLREYEKLCGVTEPLRIVNIQGTPGSTAQIGRTDGLREAAEEYGWEILEERSGDFTQAKGREAMEELLSRYEDIQVVYCENDNMALGVIEAIEAAGKTTGMDLLGGDICVLSFDGVKEQALSLAREGKIACIGECNPNLGPYVEQILQSLLAGETPPQKTIVSEKIFSSEERITSLSVLDETYEVTILKKD